MAAFSGQTVVMQCGTNATVKLLWRFQNSSSSTVTIFTGNKLTGNSGDFFEVDNSTEGEFDLIIKANPSTAGRYICDEPGSTNASAELIVIADHRVSNTMNDNGSRFDRLVCSVRYYGNLVPTMEWRENDAQGINDTNAITNGVNISLFNDTLMAELTVYNYSFSNYTCRISFTANKRPTNTAATNIPDYTYSWTFSKPTTETSQAANVTVHPPVLTDSTDFLWTTAYLNSTKPSKPRDITELVFYSMVGLCVILILIVCLVLARHYRGWFSVLFSCHAEKRESEQMERTTSNSNAHATRPGKQQQQLDLGGHDQELLDRNSYLQMISGEGDYAAVSQLQCHEPESNGPTTRALLTTMNKKAGSPILSRYVGADGTEYMELNGLQEQLLPVPQIQPSTFNRSIYAAIDHTLRAPPPPPK